MGLWWGHRTITFSSQIGLSGKSQRKAIIKQSQIIIMVMLKIKMSRILFCFIAIVYLLRANMSKVLNID